MSLECLSNVNDSPGDQTNVTLTLSLRRSLSWERIDANVCWPLVAPAVTALCQSPGPYTDIMSMTSEVTARKSGERQRLEARLFALMICWPVSWPVH